VTLTVITWLGSSGGRNPLDPVVITVDPIVLASRIVLSLQTIVSRENIHSTLL
jgi:hypothetical protein